MASKRWQYPIKAEVISIEGEGITLDKWFSRTSEPVRKLFVPFYYPYSDFRTDLAIISIETITLDKWYQPLSEPIRAIFKFQPDYSFWNTQTPLSVFEWYLPTIEPIKEKLKAYYITPVAFQETIVEAPVEAVGAYIPIFRPRRRR